MRSLTVRTKLLIGGVLAVAVTPAVLVSLSPREPEHQGKPLSYWLDHLPATLTWTNVPYSILTPASYKQFLTNLDAADKAVDVLGARNLPKLVERLRTRANSMTRLKHAFRRAAVQFGLCELSWQIDTSWFRRGQAIYALCRLGDQALPVFPQVVALAKYDNDPGVRRDALEVLRRLSPADYTKVMAEQDSANLRRGE